MKIYSILLTLFFTTIYQLSTAQDCSWDDGICISYCSDGQNNDGANLFCGDPNATSIENPFSLGFCFSDEAEAIGSYINPFTGEEVFYERDPRFLLCVPDDVCSGNIKVFKIETTVNGVVETPLSSNTLVPNGTTRRQTFCDNCPPRSDGRVNYEFLPRSKAGKYKVELEYLCCEEGNEECCSDAGGEMKTTEFYYEIVDAASEIDIDISFTASQTIEDINGDPDIDGIIASTGGSPGPELGPLSGGVRITTVGFGVNSYTVNLFEVDCGNPNFTTSISSQTIPYNGNESITYRFINISNWEDIYTPNACYKVEVIVESICGTFTDEAFFTITNQCSFCRQAGKEDVYKNEINVYPNPSNGIINITSKIGITELFLIDESGKIILNQNLQDSQPTQHRIEFSQKGVFFLRIIDGRGEKANRLITSF